MTCKNVQYVGQIIYWRRVGGLLVPNSISCKPPGHKNQSELIKLIFYHHLTCFAAKKALSNTSSSEVTVTRNAIGSRDLSQWLHSHIKQSPGEYHVWCSTYISSFLYSSHAAIARYSTCCDDSHILQLELIDLAILWVTEYSVKVNMA